MNLSIAQSLGTTLNRTPIQPHKRIAPAQAPSLPRSLQTEDNIALQLVLLKEIKNHHKPKTPSPHGNSNTPGICDDDNDALSLDNDSPSS